MEITEDDIVGTVRKFRDSWRGRPALCLLVGEGGGPQGESVRVVGNPVRGGGGFTVSYVRSYEPGHGNAARVYEYLSRTYGGVHAKEVRSAEGLGFHRTMAERGIVTSMEVEVPEQKAAPSPR